MPKLWCPILWGYIIPKKNLNEPYLRPIVENKQTKQHPQPDIFNNFQYKVEGVSMLNNSP